MRRRALVALGAVVCAAVAGCTSGGQGAPAASPSTRMSASPSPSSAPAPSSSSSSPPSVPSCPSAFRKLVDRSTGAAAVTEHVQHSANLITCRYLIGRTARSACSEASVLVNTAANAYVDFQRWAVEAGQVAMWTHHQAQNPQPVPGIGIEADWVPSTETFETATKRTWVAVFLTCAPRSAADRQLAIALGRAGLASASRH